MGRTCRDGSKSKLLNYKDLKHAKDGEGKKLNRNHQKAFFADLCGGMEKFELLRNEKGMHILRKSVKRFVGWI